MRSPTWQLDYPSTSRVDSARTQRATESRKGPSGFGSRHTCKEQPARASYTHHSITGSEIANGIQRRLSCPAPLQRPGSTPPSATTPISCWARPSTI